MNDVNDNFILDILLNSKVFLKNYSFLLNDIQEYELDFLNKYKSKFLNERHHTIHIPMQSQIGNINCEINIFYKYKINLFTKPKFYLHKKTNIRLILDNIPNFSGEYLLSIDYNGKYNLKVINKVTKETIIKKGSKNFEKLIEPFKSLFLNSDELNIFNVKNFTELKTGWLETYNLIEY